MMSRQGIVAIFSTFLQFAGDRTTGWITDSRLQRSMTTCVEQVSSNQSETFWALYWHRVWQQSDPPNRMATAHLFAYLQETCYWVTRKIVRNTTERTLIPDLFQVAIARVPNLIKHFQPNRTQNLKGYAELGFKNALKDWFRTQQQVEICTDWSLLYRSSRKQLVKALQSKGISSLRVEQCVLSWECFRELVTTHNLRLNELKCPDAATWEAIATAYNSERLSQLSSSTPACSATTLEQWLTTCAQTIREYLSPRVVPIPDLRPGQDSDQGWEIPDSSNPSPLEFFQNREEEEDRQQQMAQLQSVLVDAVAALEDQSRALLQAYYGEDLTQTQIAKQLGIKQYQVSRKLEHIRRSLLQTIVQWSQETLHISPTPDVVDRMSISLEEWLNQMMRAEGNESSC